MKHLRRHWRMVVTVCAGALLGSGLFWWRSGASVAIADPPQVAVDAVQADAIRGLLEHIDLNQAALIALNLSSEQAENVLDTTFTWRTNNSSTLQDYQTAIDSATWQLRQTRLALAAGTWQQGVDAPLAEVVQAWVGARQNYDNQLASLKSSIQQLLSQSQAEIWTAIAQGYGQSMPIQMLNLSDAQRQSLNKAQRTYRRQHAAATSAEQRAQALSAWQTAQSQIYTQGQSQLITAYHGYYETASQAVLTAMNDALIVDS